MLRALYDFKALNLKTLGFEKNEFLYYLGSHPRDKNWLRVTNYKGSIGLVPINYISVDAKIYGESVINFLDEAIRSARREKTSSVEELLDIRHNVLGNPQLLEERMSEIETEINELMAKAITELKNDDNTNRKSKSHEVISSTQQIPVNSHKSQSAKAILNASNGSIKEEEEIEKTPKKAHTKSKKTVKCQSSVKITNKDKVTSNNLIGSQSQPIIKHNKNVFEVKESTPSFVIMTATTVENTRLVSKRQPPIMTSEEVELLKKEYAYEMNLTSPSIQSDHKIIDPEETDNALPIQTNLAGELVDGVRNATGLSHELSQIAVQTVLKQLQSHFLGITDQIDKLMKNLEDPFAIRNFPTVISTSSDAVKLREIFRKLTNCKDDEQQRSWALIEDEDMIIELTILLNTILKNADHSISILVMNEDHYNSVHALVLYYQMETRLSIRKLLIESFAYMATIDPKALSVILNSILPMELAREILADQTNLERFSSSATLLGILLSTGEHFPITHYEMLGTDFINFVLDIIENPPEDDEKITNVFLNLLLAYNLHFNHEDQENLTITTLSERSNAKVFTQKIIYLLNWEVDPIAVTVNVSEPKPEHSVFKLLTDIFSCAKTADLFYTNDVKVLIDIVTRCLTDLCSGDSRRNSYLKLIRAVLRNSHYNEHRHRNEDILKCFTTILVEEDELSDPNKALTREIIKENPAYFSNN